MSETLVVGAIAGAVAGAIAATAVVLLHQRRGSARTHRTPASTGPRSDSRSGPWTFDRLDQGAKRVLALAQDEAVRFDHNYMGTEHLLIALLREGEGSAARALDLLGVDLATVRRSVEITVRRGDATTSPSEITLSPRTKKVMELALDEARKLGHDHIGTEHILLGLVREGEGIASGVLQSLGVSLEKVRHQVLATLGPQDPGA